MSDGPTSFGPSESWDYIYFVDCMDFENMNFKVYEIRLSNIHHTWKNIKISGDDFDISQIPELPSDHERVLHTFKGAELKKLCADRGLTQSGNKSDLITKLMTQKPGSKFNKLKTYGDIVKKNSRGELRGCFEKIFKPQLEKSNECRLIFNGHISKLS